MNTLTLRLETQSLVDHLSQALPMTGSFSFESSKPEESKVSFFDIPNTAVSACSNKNLHRFRTYSTNELHLGLINPSIKSSLINIIFYILFCISGFRALLGKLIGSKIKEHADTQLNIAAYLATFYVPLIFIFKKNRFD